MLIWRKDKGSWAVFSKTHTHPHSGHTHALAVRYNPSLLLCFLFDTLTHSKTTCVHQPVWTIEQFECMFYTQPPWEGAEILFKSQEQTIVCSFFAPLSVCSSYFCLFVRLSLLSVLVLCPAFPVYFSCAPLCTLARLSVCCSSLCKRTCLFRSLLWNKLHSGWGAKWLISGTQIKIQLLQFEATQE